jgi:hypothetical protein
LWKKRAIEKPIVKVWLAILLAKQRLVGRVQVGSSKLHGLMSLSPRLLMARNGIGAQSVETQAVGQILIPLKTTRVSENQGTGLQKPM